MANAYSRVLVFPLWGIGDTGPFLQYTHARLCSISDLGDVNVDPLCSLDGLKEPVARNLVDILSRYDETLDRSLTTLEPAGMCDASPFPT